MKNIVLTAITAFFYFYSVAQPEVSIYDIQGQEPESPYHGQVVTTTGMVTGVFGAGFFMQDGQGEWNGIYVYTSQSVTRGDEIRLTAEVDEYYELTELKNVDGLEILSSGNTLPEPAILSTWDVNDEAWEGVLVKVENAVCTDPDLGYGEWELNDGTGPCIVDDLGIVYIPGEGLTYSVTGPLYFSFGAYKIEPRDESDIEILENLYFVENPEQIDPATNQVTIVWQTNVPATTEAFYGQTPELELGHAAASGQPSTDHEITIPLDYGSLIYYIRPFSVSENDTTPDFTRTYALVSGSSGEIKVYFNHKVDHSVALEEPAVWTNNITDTVISWIGKATQTLDITMYEQESERIVEAINQAWDSGVMIRYITDDEGNNPALENLNPEIPVLYGNSQDIMHNKFIVIDAADEMNSWVITGSLNHTHNNLGWDYNNMICIQDQSLALSYVLEFEEMWGTDGPEPNGESALFGSEKKDNTPHQFLIGGIPVKLYFSPSDGTTAKIAQAINNSQEWLEFGIMVFTENSLGDAVLDAHNRGLDVRGIIDYVENPGSEYGELKENGVQVRDYVNPDGTSWPDGPVFHHKYMIADFGEGSENAVLVTGSHNWSASAESANDENTLIIHDLNLANQFHQEFKKRYDEQLTPVVMPDDTVTPVNTLVSIAFLDNDFVPEDVSAGYEIVVDPFRGTAAVELPYLDYQPQSDFEGIDSLSYRLFNTDRPELADTAWIFIEVGESGIFDKMELNGFGITSLICNGNSIDLVIHSRERRAVDFRLYSTTGQLMTSAGIRLEHGQNDLRVPKPQTPGIYILELKSTSGVVTGKIFVR